MSRGVKNTPALIKKLRSYDRKTHLPSPSRSFAAGRGRKLFLALILSDASLKINAFFIPLVQALTRAGAGRSGKGAWGMGMRKFEPHPPSFCLL